jgi:ABC-type antimicrobial peptide transport system permease subunit
MLFSDLLKLSFRMFKARTMRTVLTILGMSVGIAAILLLVSFGYGIQKTLLEKITTSDALSTVDVTRAKEDAPMLDADTIGKIRILPRVETVLPVVEIRGQAKISGVTLDTGMTIASPQFLKLEGIKFDAGTNFNAEKNEVVITGGMAKAFQKDPRNLIGQSVTLSLFIPKEGSSAKKNSSADMEEAIAQPFVIAGIAKNDENLLYLAPESVSRITLPSATKLKVKGLAAGDLPAIRDGIGKLSLTASSISETIDQANKVFTVIQLILMFFGTIALIVSAIGMFNTMTIALLERTEEIGIMKSIGATPGSISLMFIMESTLMGFLGSLVGVIFGLAGGGIINLLFNLIATNFGGAKATLFYSPLWFIMTIIAFGAFVGFLTGLIPARKAAKTDALEALRYK